VSDMNQHLAAYRAKLRKLQDQGKATNHELLGLHFDLYEIFMVLSEDTKSDMLEAMMGAGGPKMFKLSPEEFDKVVESDKKAKKATGEPKISKGQYL